MLNWQTEMYLPKHFAEPDITVLQALMHAHPLATVITSMEDGLSANHLPLHLSAQDSPLGVLRGHIARANPLGHGRVTDVDTLVIFHGPDAYISPAWYPGKADTGRVVPTWNYVVAHAHGTLRIVDDADWLYRHLVALTAQHEAAFAQPWLIKDAPTDYIQRMMQGVVGLEVEITRLSGKWKASQNQPAANQSGVITGLRTTASATAQRMAEEMTRLIKRHQE